VQDFAAAGHMWTAALCAKDSDGDGATNGVELGDPTCVWTVGADPTGSATGHPGYKIFY
jgi:dopamine beta-monooxygenase